MIDAGLGTKPPPPPPPPPELATLWGIFPFWSSGNTGRLDHDPNPFDRPIKLNACPSPDMDIVVSFAIANYNPTNVPLSFNAFSTVNSKQVIGVCPGTSYPATPCSSYSQSSCDVTTVFANPQNNGQLVNPLVIPAGTALYPVYPFICNVVANTTNNTYMKTPAYTMGIAFEMCYPPGQRPQGGNA